VIITEISEEEVENNNIGRVHVELLLLSPRLCHVTVAQGRGFAPVGVVLSSSRLLFFTSLSQCRGLVDCHTLPQLIVPASAKCFYSKMVKHSVLTKINSVTVGTE
jgi:hypothetical protein